jgi:outer membrane protein assembly factor BamA
MAACSCLFCWIRIPSLAICRAWTGQMWVAVWLMCSAAAYSQAGDKPVSIRTADALDKDLPALPARVADSASVEGVLQKWLTEARLQGWWMVSVDSLRWEGDTVLLRIHTGQRCRRFVPVFTDSVQAFLREQGRASLLQPQVFAPEVPKNIAAYTSMAYEDAGHAFAEVTITGYEAVDEDILLHLRVRPGKVYRIGKLVNAGDARISEGFLMRYTGLRKGQRYSRDVIARRVPKLLNDLPYVLQRKEPVVLFDSTTATVNVFLQKRQSSRFDFVLGALPSNAETGRLLVTGSALLELQNQFGLGERSFLMFQRLRPETQELRAAFEYPYPLNLPFGIDLSFHLYSRDTTNRDITYQLGLSYRMAGNNYVRAFWQRFQTDLLSVDLARVRTQKRLPPSLDVLQQLYGVEAYWEKLDARFNPRQGWRIRTSAATGLRSTPVNPQIERLTDPENPGFSFASLYDTLEGQGSQWKFQADVSWFLPLAKRSTIHVAYRGGWLYSSRALFRNELFRIGGNRLLRGFDEESIFTGFYHVLTGEYRLLTGPYSHLFAFADVGWLDNQTGETSLRDTPIGLGIGLTFDTSLGLFGLTLAQGRQLGNPWDFRATKLHFGYVSMF